jgi:hypothetical protein
VGVASKRLDSYLSQQRRIGIDTSVFIDHVEENARYIEQTQRIFD